MGNAGVSLCYPGGYVAFTRKGTGGRICALFTDEQLQVPSLARATPGQPKSTERQLSVVDPVNLKNGLYGLLVSVGGGVETPAFALPLASNHGHHRYCFGHVHLFKS